jgi:uncharacterized membrane protein
MSEMSPGEIEQAQRRPVDNLHQSRFARAFVPIFALVTFVSLAVVTLTKGDAEDIVVMALPFVLALVLLIRMQRPMHTWPEWLFRHEP